MSHHFVQLAHINDDLLITFRRTYPFGTSEDRAPFASSVLLPACRSPESGHACSIFVFIDNAAMRSGNQLAGSTKTSVVTSPDELVTSSVAFNTLPDTRLKRVVDKTVGSPTFDVTFPP